jgi:radical SAM protein with 4Fe4S-binding SPASM domain
MMHRDFQNTDSEKRMSLILKPTEACNFSCDFCSSTELVDNKKERLELEKIYAFLKRFPKTDRVFVVGGDPLMMTPEYYVELIDHIETHNYPAIISMTTNLWDFYKKPEKWADILRHPKVEVGTSFQYGDGRKITKDLVFTEHMFRLVVRKFKEYIPNKELCFLAVISKENEHLALDHVYLAKDMNMQCRLVYANKSGLTGEPYPLSKLYKIFIQIWKLGLVEYEQTTLSIMDKILGVEVACPLSRNCDHWMRSINPDGRYFTCGPLNDDLDPDNEIDFESEVIRGEKFHLPLQLSPKNQYLKEECFTCEMFQVCNGCRKHVKDLKQEDMVEEHCINMKDIIGDLNQMSNDGELIQMQKDIDLMSNSDEQITYQ